MDMLLLMLGVSDTVRLPPCSVHGGGCRLIRVLCFLSVAELKARGERVFACQLCRPYVGRLTGSQDSTVPYGVQTFGRDLYSRVMGIWLESHLNDGVLGRREATEVRFSEEGSWVKGVRSRRPTKLWSCSCLYSVWYEVYACGVIDSVNIVVVCDSSSYHVESEAV